MASDWINHVKAYSQKHNMSYKEAMSKAKASYKPKKSMKDKPMKEKPMKEKPMKEKSKK